MCLFTGLAFFLLVQFLLDDLEAQTMQVTEEIMVDTAYSYADVLSDKIEGVTVLDEKLCRELLPYGEITLAESVKIYDLDKRQIGLHLYVTEYNGRVIYDSNDSKFVGQDFSKQNDVYLTLKGKYGARSSKGEEGGLYSILYVAAPIVSNEKVIGVLSCYKSQLDVMPFVHMRRRKIIQVSILLGLAVMLFVGGVFFLVYRPIGKLTDYARGVIDGQKPEFPNLGKGREINTLGTALKSMRDTLEGRAYTRNFVQTLTHELKSPITAIGALAEILQDKEMPIDKRRHFLQSIEAEVKRSENVIDRLNQLSLVEEMTHLERKEKLNVESFIHELLVDYKAMADSKYITVNVDIYFFEVIGDPFLIRSVFQNLLDNAFKYVNESGQVNVRIQQADNKHHIYIENTGDSIPKYARGRIFERMFSLQSNDWPDDNRMGSGVGLAIVKESMILHQGAVEYTYVEGLNVFKVEFPI